MNENIKDRSNIIHIVFLLAAGLLLFKALQIQLLDTSYEARANATAIDKYVLYPSRGLIFDRNGKLLVNNNPIYDIKVTYNQLNTEMDTSELCELLRIDSSAFLKNINKNWRDKRFSKSVPFIFLSKVSPALAVRFMEHLYKFPGFSVQLRNVRGYPHRNSAHVLGYINEVSPAQLEADKSNSYSLGDYIGATGLEAFYEHQLRGRKGARFVLKDNLGREVGPYKNGRLDSVAISGADLISTIDVQLQAYGEQLMQNKTGSIVAIEPASGQILCMVSSPTYDPNKLTIHRDRGVEFNKLMKDTLKPFFDRSIMAKYPPGSIFKTVVALVGMQEGVLNINRGVTCNMGYYYKGQVRKCHAHPHPYNVATALQHSCNAYFFTVLREIIDKYGFYNPHQGLDTFVNHLYDFGLGKALGTDIPNELSGNVPTSGVYDKMYPKDKGSWYSPTIMSIGIGQGEIQMTSLQMANLAAIIANRGWYITPHLIKGFRQAELAVAPEYTTPKRVRIEQQYFEPVVDGMEMAVTGGTARIAYLPDIPICGKTGTSQNPHGKDHSVFFAFAPKDKPEIAIAVYVEHGIWGATYAAPIASLMIEKYQTDSIASNRKWLENNMLNANLVVQP